MKLSQQQVAEADEKSRRRQSEMECAESVAKLSEYHDEELAAEQAVQVRAHLAACAPCDGVYRELDEIVVAASHLGAEAQVCYPDEAVLWQRLAIAGQDNS